MAAMKVFGPVQFTNVARVMLCLEEVGAEYDAVDIDFRAKEHKKPHHLARNPFGEIPAFQDGDLTLFESRAIGRYILRKHRSELLREGTNLEEAAMVDVWTEVEAHTYHPAMSPIVYECIFYPVMYNRPTNQEVVEESLEKLKKVLQVYNARLSENKYLAGDFISFADLSHFPFTLYFMETPHATLFDSYPHVKAWWDSLVSRPSVHKITSSMLPLIMP